MILPDWPNREEFKVLNLSLFFHLHPPLPPSKPISCRPAALWVWCRQFPGSFGAPHSYWLRWWWSSAELPVFNTQKIKSRDWKINSSSVLIIAREWFQTHINDIYDETLNAAQTKWLFQNKSEIFPLLYGIKATIFALLNGFHKDTWADSHALILTLKDHIFTV